MVVTVLLAIGCSDPGAEAPPAPLVVGVLPDQSEATLRRIHEPMVDYLASVTGVELELYLPESYQDLVESFAGGRVQLAWIGGVTFIQAEERGEVEPLAMRDVDLEFTSDFLVAASAPGDTLEDFAGRRLGLGPELSTSGHLMPRYFLNQLGLTPEESFSEVQHSAGHDQTAEWVRGAVVDVGAVNTVVAEAMFREGRLGNGEVRVLWRTPPYRNYVWAIRSHLDPGLKARLLDAFLSLEADVPEHAAILIAQGATQGYLPATAADYADLRRASAQLRQRAADRVSR